MMTQPGPKGGEQDAPKELQGAETLLKLRDDPSRYDTSSKCLFSLLPVLTHSTDMKQLSPGPLNQLRKQRGDAIYRSPRPS